MNRREKLQDRVVRLLVAREIDRALTILRPRVSPDTFTRVLLVAREFAAERDLHLRTAGMHRA